MRSEIFVQVVIPALSLGISIYCLWFHAQVRRRVKKLLSMVAYFKTVEEENAMWREFFQRIGGDPSSGPPPELPDVKDAAAIERWLRDE